MSILLAIISVSVIGANPAAPEEPRNIALPLSDRFVSVYHRLRQALPHSLQNTNQIAHFISFRHTDLCVVPGPNASLCSPHLQMWAFESVSKVQISGLQVSKQHSHWIMAEGLHTAIQIFRLSPGRCETSLQGWARGCKHTKHTVMCVIIPFYVCLWLNSALSSDADYLISLWTIARLAQ